MSHRIWRVGLLGCTASLATLCAAQAQNAGAGSAANTAATNADLAEIIVTAEKRSERIEDVPMSITAATGAQLAKLGITETAQLTKLVPGFAYQQGTFGSPVYSIRGIGFYDHSLSAGPTVTVYLDQVPLPYSTETRGALLDLERVEVLKGPQGTLFGMNSTGGAINYIAAKPSPELAAGADFSYGRFNDVNASAFLTGEIGRAHV